MPRLSRAPAAGVLLLALLPAGSAAQAVSSLEPGLFYYGEGEVSLNSEPIPPGPFGFLRLEAGQSVETVLGFAELLMGPDAVLRVGFHSRVELVSASGGDFVLRLLRGEAALDLLAPARGRTFAIACADARVEPRKRGVYQLSASAGASPTLVVYQGAARVENAGLVQPVGRGRALDLTDPAALPTRHSRASDAPFELWSQQRRQVLAAQRAAASRRAGDVAETEGFFWGDADAPSPRPAAYIRDSREDGDSGFDH